MTERNNRFAEELRQAVDWKGETNLSYTYPVLGTDTDYKDQLHMHSLFSMLQEAASIHASDIGWGAETLDGMNVCWLLLRMSVRMIRRPSWKENVTVETWSRGSDRLYFHRDFRILSDKGEVLGAASSIWILANTDSHRPVRPDQVPLPQGGAFNPNGILRQEPPKIASFYSKLSEEERSHEKTILKFADFSEIDRNLHVNNTRYVAWCVDAAHAVSFDDGDIIGIDICYYSEIRFSEKVLLYTRDLGDIFQVDGVPTDSGKPAFSAILYRDVSPRNDTI